MIQIDCVSAVRWGNTIRSTGDGHRGLGTTAASKAKVSQLTPAPVAEPPYACIKSVNNHQNSISKGRVGGTKRAAWWSASEKDEIAEIRSAIFHLPS